MRTSLLITPLVYMMVQAVLFGAGMISIMATPLSARADVLIPWMAGISFMISVPIALWIAPHLKARREILSRAPAE